jgi:hypothetical protein
VDVEMLFACESGNEICFSALAVTFESIKSSSNLLSHFFSYLQSCKEHSRSILILCSSQISCAAAFKCINQTLAPATFNDSCT